MIDSTTDGNQMKMREALESVREWCINKLGDSSFHVTVEGLLCVVNNALSAPERNCDVGTAEEQGDRCMAQFNEWRRKSNGKKLITAIMAWAQMPYESEAKNGPQE